MANDKNFTSIESTVLFSLWLLHPLWSMAKSNPTDRISRSSLIVMVGNSITFQGDWKKVLTRNDVTNWGIPGFTTGQIA